MPLDRPNGFSISGVSQWSRSNEAWLPVIHWPRIFGAKMRRKRKKREKKKN